MIQFLDIANEIHTGDFAAIEDTIDVLVFVVAGFIAVTMILNMIVMRLSKHPKVDAPTMPIL